MFLYYDMTKAYFFSIKLLLSREIEFHVATLYDTVTSSGKSSFKRQFYSERHKQTIVIAGQSEHEIKLFTDLSTNRRSSYYLSVQRNHLICLHHFLITSICYNLRYLKNSRFLVSSQFKGYRKADAPLHISHSPETQVNLVSQTPVPNIPVKHTWPRSVQIAHLFE